ncbi:MAG: trigger factor [Lachnospiraceae bacterium]|jgi:trigger factor|nr:trigger factor [Lachnospiraceae bacterium]MCH4030699.1 trigger factor [Lachnospiraceae bacterium]MCH4070671.1 trigger factor [Lachnospiraceae bacterium]MCH4107153.1 trigger factor [Lachnospiraceae bacterium]MCI1301992.1 trigger factor [Lachnospiraceae bacterium]
MSFKVENTDEKNVVKLVIEVSDEAFEKGLNKAYNRDKSRINVPGFRRGKAPRKLIEKMYGADVFYEGAANEVIPEEYSKAAEESKLDIVSRPKISATQLEVGKPFIFTAEVAVRPEVELGQYKGVEVDKQDTEVTDKDIEDELKKVQEQNARKVEVTDRAVKDGDETVIDFDGFVDGKEFEGGKGTDYPLTIGSHSFIPGFEDQMIGMEIGSEKDINVTFPEDYHAEELKGKPAVFKVTVKKITEKQLPELTDEFASDVSDFETLDEYKNDLKNQISKRKEDAARSSKETQAMDKITADAKMDIPKAMIDTQCERMGDDFAQRLSQQGISIDQYYKYTGLTPDKLLEQFRPEAEKRIKNSLCLEEIAKQEKLEATDEDLEEQLKKMADAYKMDIEKIRSMMGDAEKEQMKADIAIDKAVKFVVDNAVETEKKAEENTEDKDEKAEDKQ